MKGRPNAEREQQADREKEPRHAGDAAGVHVDLAATDRARTRQPADEPDRDVGDALLQQCASAVVALMSQFIDGGARQRGLQARDERGRSGELKQHP